MANLPVWPILMIWQLFLSEHCIWTFTCPEYYETLAVMETESVTVTQSTVLWTVDQSQVRSLEMSLVNSLDMRPDEASGQHI